LRRASVKLTKKGLWEGVIREYREFLPRVNDESVVTLREGNTPLIEALNLKDILGDIRLLLKYEGVNPTGSFKDRGMTMAVSGAKQEGSRAVICASTGNTSASAAAYAAKASMKAFVLVPEGAIAKGKLSQAMMHGVNSLNPLRIEGQKTAAFEVCEHLGHAPTYHFIPVGNAGNITAYWKGYKEYRSKGIISSLPKMMGFQAEGAAPIVRGEPVTDPQTVASAIRIGNPASWKEALKARDESEGTIDMVSDEEILEAYGLLSSREGVFCEPASAASVAGVIKKKKEEVLSDGDTVVCTLTGHGLKDPDTAIETAREQVKVAAEIDKIVEVMRF
jgi:threonine synthase